MDGSDAREVSAPQGRSSLWSACRHRPLGAPAPFALVLEPTLSGAADRSAHPWSLAVGVVVPRPVRRGRQPDRGRVGDERGRARGDAGPRVGQRRRWSPAPGGARSIDGPARRRARWVASWDRVAAGRSARRRLGVVAGARRQVRVDGDAVRRPVLSVGDEVSGPTGPDRSLARGSPSTSFARSRTRSAHTATSFARSRTRSAHTATSFARSRTRSAHTATSFARSRTRSAHTGWMGHDGGRSGIRVRVTSTARLPCRSEVEVEQIPDDGWGAATPAGDSRR